MIKKFLVLTNIGNLLTYAETLKDAQSQLEETDGENGVHVLRDKDGQPIVMSYPYSLHYTRNGAYNPEVAV